MAQMVDASYVTAIRSPAVTSFREEGVGPPRSLAHGGSEMYVDARGGGFWITRALGVVRHSCSDRRTGSLD